MLSHIDLSNCRFSGLIPNSFGNLTQLTELDLSSNRFIGRVPSFSFQKNLTSISLQGNGLTGQISDSHWEGLENLIFLDISWNSLDGEIPPSLLVLPSLEVLFLNNNRFYGSLRELTNGRSYSLNELDLSVNNLEGSIPQFLFELHNLSRLSLSRNKFNGSVDLTAFIKLSSLLHLDLSYNLLSVYTNENVSMPLLPPNLRNLVLACCNLQKFPPLQNISSLKRLDFADNKLSGEIPNWIWKFGNGTSHALNLSHNQFTSMQEPYDMSNSMSFLDLHSNMLGGQIPVLAPFVIFLDFSNNNFSSSLPENIGNSLSYTFFFSIANNNISGTIPPSLCSTTNMEFLDLSNNSFHGRIPSCLVAQTLTVLILRRNNLSAIYLICLQLLVVWKLWISVGIIYKDRFPYLCQDAQS